MKTKEWETKTEWFNRLTRIAGGWTSAALAAAGFVSAGIGLSQGEWINVAVGCTLGAVLAVVAAKLLTNK